MQLILRNKLLNKSPLLKINRSLHSPRLSLTAGHMTGRPSRRGHAVEGRQGLLFVVRVHIYSYYTETDPN